jgi:hypothetical protein
MTTINFEPKGNRKCGGCTLCCKLLPVRELDKEAGERCRHQRAGKGCAVYRRPGMPASCHFWTCRWLTGDDTGELHRPDRSRYVIDVMPDFVTCVDDITGRRWTIEVVQIWCDPKAREAWRRDQALLDYIERRGKEGKAAIVRFNNREACTVFPPDMSDDRQWHYRYDGTIGERTHTFYEIARAISKSGGVA